MVNVLVPPELTDEEPEGEMAPPVPFTVAVMALETVLLLNVAVTMVAPFIVVAHSPVPLHPPPDQPAKIDPESAFEERDTTVAGL